jgi:hypothetical protein
MNFFKNWKWTHVLLVAFGLVWYIAAEIARIPATDGVLLALVTADSEFLHFIPAIAVGLGLVTGSVLTPPVLGSSLETDLGDVLRRLSDLAADVKVLEMPTPELPTPVPVPVPVPVPAPVPESGTPVTEVATPAVAFVPPVPPTPPIAAEIIHKDPALLCPVCLQPCKVNQFEHYQAHRWTCKPSRMTR